MRDIVHPLVERPPCPKCGYPMEKANLYPGKTEITRRAFRCRYCRNIQTMKIDDGSDQPEFRSVEGPDAPAKEKPAG